MTGSLQTKNGKYYMVLNSTENGKRKQRWIATGLAEKGNKRKAEQMLRERLVQEAQKAPLPQPDMLLADCVRHWLVCSAVSMKSLIWAISTQRKNTFSPTSTQAALRCVTVLLRHCKPISMKRRRMAAWMEKVDYLQRPCVTTVTSSVSHWPKR